MIKEFAKPMFYLQIHMWFVDADIIDMMIHKGNYQQMVCTYYNKFTLPLHEVLDFKFDNP